jgi:hypothetical protein
MTPAITIDADYWSYQYLIHDHSEPGFRWWPEEGIMEFATEDEALRAMQAYFDSCGTYDAEARIIHVIKHVEIAERQRNPHFVVEQL